MLGHQILHPSSIPDHHIPGPGAKTTMRVDGLHPLVQRRTLGLVLRRIHALDDLDVVMIELPRPALFLAGKAFVRYRRQGGTKSNVLGDFFIGAHAAVSGLSILTRDTRRYATYFPSVALVTPPA